VYVANSLCEVIKKVLLESRMISNVSVLSEFPNTKFAMKEGWKGYREDALMRILVKEECALMGCKEFDIELKVLKSDY
jgi:hypothetical protein